MLGVTFDLTVLRRYEPNMKSNFISNLLDLDLEPGINIDVIHFQERTETLHMLSFLSLSLPCRPRPTLPPWITSNFVFLAQ